MSHPRPRPLLLGEAAPLRAGSVRVVGRVEAVDHVRGAAVLGHRGVRLTADLSLLVSSEN